MANRVNEQKCENGKRKTGMDSSKVNQSRDKVHERYAP